MAGNGTIPTPITMDELEDMLMEHGITDEVDGSSIQDTPELAASFFATQRWRVK